MKVNVLQVLKNFDGLPMKENRQDGTDDNDKPVMKVVDLTLRSVLCTALMHTTQKEAQAGPSADDRIRRFMLAQEVYKNDVVVMSSEDVTYLKQTINQLFSTNVVAVSHLMLDPVEKVSKGKTAEKAPASA